MSKYGAAQYIRLLDMALKYIKYYNKSYNRNLENEMNKYKLDYHIFTFTQLVFSIRERLEADFSKDKTKISKFFERGVAKRTSDIGIAIKLANEWKHKEGYAVRQHFSNLRRGPDGNLIPTKVEKRLPVKHKLNVADKPITKIFERVLKDLTSFCKANKYI